MTKTELTEKVNACKSETGECLQTLFDAINKGQQKQIVKIEKIKEMFDRFGVSYDGR